MTKLRFFEIIVPIFAFLNLMNCCGEQFSFLSRQLPKCHSIELPVRVALQDLNSERIAVVAPGFLLAPGFVLEVASVALDLNVVKYFCSFGATKSM